jgi:hypothetical protein
VPEEHKFPVWLVGERTFDDARTFLADLERRLSNRIQLTTDGWRAYMRAVDCMGSVPPSEAGVASGTNSMIRELGGVLGIAVLASVFARPGIYDSPQAFIDGFTQALWVGVGLSAVGAAAALLAPGRRRPDQAPAAAQPALALGGERT